MWLHLLNSSATSYKNDHPATSVHKFSTTTSNEQIVPKPNSISPNLSNNILEKNQTQNSKNEVIISYSIPNQNTNLAAGITHHKHEEFIESDKITSNGTIFKDIKPIIAMVSDKVAHPNTSYETTKIAKPFNALNAQPSLVQTSSEPSRPLVQPKVAEQLKASVQLDAAVIQPNLFTTKPLQQQKIVIASLPVEPSLSGQQNSRVELRQPTISISPVRLPGNSNPQVQQPCPQPVKGNSFVSTNNLRPSIVLAQGTNLQRQIIPSEQTNMVLTQPLSSQVGIPGQIIRKFVKCLDTNGKIIVMELQVDPKNPKNIKFIKNSAPPSVLSAIKPDGIKETLKVPNITTNLLQNMAVSKPNALLNNICVQENANPSLLQKMSTSSTKSTRCTIEETIMPSETKTNNVITKNRQIFTINQVRPKSVNKPKQESLLKPQISLLKPLATKNIKPQSSLLIHPSSSKVKINQPSPIVSNLTTNGNAAMKINTGTASAQLNHILSTENNKIPMSLKINNPIGPTKSIFKTKYILSNIKKAYNVDLNRLFFERCTFQSVRSSIEYLLKSLPLINKMASTSHSDYTQCFPFVVDSLDTFNNLMMPKQRSLEVSINIFFNTNFNLTRVLSNF